MQVPYPAGGEQATAIQACRPRWHLRGEETRHAQPRRRPRHRAHQADPPEPAPRIRPAARPAAASDLAGPTRPEAVTLPQIIFAAVVFLVGIPAAVQLRR